MSRITMYHATNFENLSSILSKGILRGCDGLVYLCDNKEDAAKFVAIRGIENIAVLGVRIDEKDVEESFDHSYRFFKCRAYTTNKDIPSDKILLNDIFQYNL